MKRERIEKLKQSRKAVEEAKAKRDEKLLMDIEKGVNEMHYFYRTLTNDGKKLWIINYNLYNLGSNSNWFNAKVRMNYTVGGAFIVHIHLYDCDVATEIGDKYGDFDAKYILENIRRQSGTYFNCVAWIFAHGGEVCDMIMDRLEEEYEKRASCQ